MFFSTLLSLLLKPRGLGYDGKGRGLAGCPRNRWFVRQVTVPACSKAKTTKDRKQDCRSTHVFPVSPIAFFA